MTAVPAPQTEGTQLVLVPLGATEQHGPHLPLDTDTRIAQLMVGEVGDRLNRSGVRTQVAPAVSYGSSGEHQDFSGTISIGTPALITMLVELVRSSSCWAPATVFINGHGGNIEAVTRAVSQLQDEGRASTWIPALTGPDASSVGVIPDAHAGALETSVLLHLCPELVQRDRAPSGNHTPLRTLMAALRRDGLAAHAPDGVLGNPRAASAAAGAEVWQQAVARCHQTLTTWLGERAGDHLQVPEATGG